jgi:hypothetical protein
VSKTEPKGVKLAHKVSFLREEILLSNNRAISLNLSGLNVNLGLRPSPKVSFIRTPNVLKTPQKRPNQSPAAAGSRWPQGAQKRVWKRLP